jgi:hypothetical protein
MEELVWNTRLRMRRGVGVAGSGVVCKWQDYHVGVRQDVMTLEQIFLKFLVPNPILIPMAVPRLSYHRSCAASILIASLNYQRRKEERNTLNLLTRLIFKIWGFHCCHYEECRLLSVTQCGCSRNRHFGETYHLQHQGDKNQQARNNVSNN